MRLRKREMRFNPAPGWPEPLPGWLPDREWQVPADWPPAPRGWPVLVPAGPLPALGRAQVQGGPDGEVSGVVLDGPDGLYCAPGRHADGRRHLLFRWEDAVDVTVCGTSGRPPACEVRVQLRSHSLRLVFGRVTPAAMQAALGPRLEELRARADHALPDLPEQLARLEELRDRGVLTEQEYEVQRGRLRP